MASPRYVQCLLIVRYKGQIPEFHANPPVQRAQIAVYAVVPRVQFYGQICHIFAGLGIKVLTSSLTDPILIDAIKSGKTKYFEIFLEKDPLFDKSTQPIVYADDWRKNLLEVVFDGHVCVKNSETWYISTRHDTDDIGLLDEDNLNTIEHFWSQSKCKTFIPLIYCPILSYECTREKLNAVYLRKYSGEKVINMLEGRGLTLVQKDAKDTELVFGAVDLDRSDLLESLLKWGAGIYYRSSAGLTCGQDSVSGDIVRDLLVRAVENCTPNSYRFLTKLDDSRSRESDLRILRNAVSYRWKSNNFSVFIEALYSRGSNLDFILDPEFRQNLAGYGDPVPRRLWQSEVFEFVELVKAANLNVNKSFAQNATLRQRNGNALLEKLLYFESRVRYLYEEDVDFMKELKIEGSDLSIYDILNAGVPEILRILRNIERAYDLMMLMECLNDSQNRYHEMLKWKLRRACYRGILLKKGVKMFNFLFARYPNLPNEIKENVLDYLSNLDLLILINLCKLPDSKSSFS